MPSPSDSPLPPGQAASRVTDEDLIGFHLSECTTVAEMYALSPGNATSCSSGSATSVPTKSHQPCAARRRTSGRSGIPS